MRRNMNVILTLVFFSFGLCFAFQSKRPIIGVLLAARLDPDLICGGENGYYQAAPSNYNLFIQQAGGRAVPIFIKQSAEYYEKIFARINGVLLPGGPVDLVSSYYGKVAMMAYEYARKQNDAGNYFIIWGTCLGMQELAILPLHPVRNLLSDCQGTFDVALPLTFTSDVSRSNMYKDLPVQINTTLSKHVSPHFHECCIAMDKFEKRKELSDFYIVTTTNKDTTGLQFASTIEARDYPFYGLQWHPEKLNFWTNPSNLTQTREAVEVSQYFGNFLADELKKSTNSFASFEEEGRFVFENFKITYFEQRLEYYCLTQSDVPLFDEN